jgi:hypothetical protein
MFYGQRSAYQIVTDLCNKSRKRRTKIPIIYISKKNSTILLGDYFYDLIPKSVIDFGNISKD